MNPIIQAKTLRHTATHESGFSMRVIRRKSWRKIILEYLPEYSPDYNLIELVWHSTKEYVAHRLFKSIQEERNNFR